LTNKNWDQHARSHEETSVQENAERLLSHIARRCPRPGQKQDFDADLDYPVIDCLDKHELEHFLNVLIARDWIVVGRS